MPYDKQQVPQSGWNERRGLHRVRSASRLARQELINLLQEIGNGRDGNLRSRCDLCEHAFQHPEFPILHSRSLAGNECQAVIEHLARYYAGSLNTIGVDSICEWLRAHPGVIYFDAHIAEQTKQNLGRSRMVYDFVRANPGITQFAAREKLGIAQGEMRYLLQYMEAAGTISRSPTPRTNRLYPGTIAAMESLHADEDGRSGSDQL